MNKDSRKFAQKNKNSIECRLNDGLPIPIRLVSSIHSLKGVKTFFFRIIKQLMNNSLEKF